MTQEEEKLYKMHNELQDSYIKLMKEHIELIKNAQSLVADKEILDWLQSIMTPKGSYCEVYFAGLRSGNSDASSFQIESNPEVFDVLNAPTLREACKVAMQKYPAPPTDKNLNL